MTEANTNSAEAGTTETTSTEGEATTSTEGETTSTETTTEATETTTTAAIETEATPNGNGEAANTEDGEATKSSDTEDNKSQSDEKGGGEDGADLVFKADDFKLPEDMPMNEAMMTEFLDVVNNKDLSTKDRNQELVSLYAQKTQEATDAQLQQWEDTRTSWKDQAKEDKEIGGKGYDENMALAQKALSEFGSKELIDFGNKYGWADNPEYLRLLVRVGKLVSEDQSGGNDGGGGGNQGSITDRWYGGKDADNE